jgi:hypothetical protein
MASALPRKSVRFELPELLREAIRRKLGDRVSLERLKRLSRKVKGRTNVCDGQHPKET